MDIQKELDYLRSITTKYEAHYLKGYFGFTLKDFADRMGVAKNSFTQILQGKRNLTEKHREAFLQAFNDLKVMEKTRDFKESESQIKMKELYHKRNILTFLLFGLILLSMVGNFVEYINAIVGNARRLVYFFKGELDSYLSFPFVLIRENFNFCLSKLYPKDRAFSI